MYPRLKLLQKLLANNGAIFISIDDNESATLRLICDEIFGASNFIAQSVWKRRASSAMAYRNVSIDHEYVLIYGKPGTDAFAGLPKDYKGYSNPDNDPRGPWTTGDLTVGMTAEMRPNQYYDLVDPQTGRTYKPNASRVWSYSPASMNTLITENRIIFPDVTSKRPMKKRFLSELKAEANPMSMWITEVGLNSEGAKTIKRIFGNAVFNYSKPKSLISFLISQVMSDGDIVLDSFAGSATTAQAILEKNASGKNYHFILIEMLDYAEAISATRVKAVIDGYDGESGTGGNFSFYDLGEPLLIDDCLNGAVAPEKIREYIWFMETKTPYAPPAGDNPYYLGQHNDTDYYFYYKPQTVTVLDYAFLSTVSEKASGTVVYADLCSIGEDKLAQMGITFKKIPRDISRL